MSSAEELRNARRPVWLALAELFLDTDVRPSYVGIAETLAASPYTLDELKRILDDELTPALQSNLVVVAGEWVGFDEEWVVAEASARLGKRRWLPALVDLRSDWHVIAAMVALLRGLPDEAARRERAQVWRALLPLFCDRGAVGGAPGCAAAEEERVYREELWPWLRENVRRLAAERPEVYPAEADVERAWLERNKRR